MNKPGTIALDVGVAVGLLFALLIVYLVDGTSRAESREDFKVLHPETTRRPLKLAVTPKEGSYDDMGELLKKLGKGFRFDYIQNSDLRDLKRLNEFDVIFLTCAASTYQNIHQNEALRKFVEGGGTLYASDWRFECLLGAFPEYIDRTAMKPGSKTEDVKTRVLDKGLAEALGKKVIDLGFDLPGWKPAAFKRDKVQVAMEGDYPSENFGPVKDAPLLVKFSVGKGTVIFTSFHNNKQLNSVTEKLLNYLVFHAVNARGESELLAKIEQEGFAPTTSSLVSASAQNASLTKTYRNTKAGRLWFALTFNPQEKVKLRLEVKGPDGKVAQHEDAGPFTIEIPRAEVGDWEYTVTALNLTDPHFPFSVAVAERK